MPELYALPLNIPRCALRKGVKKNPESFPFLAYCGENHFWTFEKTIEKQFEKRKILNGIFIFEIFPNAMQSNINV